MIRFLLITLLLIPFNVYNQKGVQDKNAAGSGLSGPDYRQLYYWAASPYKIDTSDSIPAFLKNQGTEKPADVFFIHPTSFFSEAGSGKWNASLYDEDVNRLTDFRSILFQATVFNGSCRIFAPRYRQASMKTFYVMGTPEADAAFDLAYSDIRSAFMYYLQHEHNNRPLIIASHSQGTLHAIRLLQEFFDGKPLQEFLVCAYIPGFRIPMDAFMTIPVAETPSQTGGFAGWRSYEKGAMPGNISNERENMASINPVTWTTTEEWASPELHLGIMTGFETITPHTVSAGIEPRTGILWVETPEIIEENVEKRSDHHIYDYNLFWMNIRQNVRQRIEEFLK
jgi:hypothetical protein